MPLTIGIRYLLGRSIATDVTDYEGAEWPPHPARVFMALVAAHFEDPPANPAERAAEEAALRWLEALPAPIVVASGCDRRRVVTHYVPPNDFESSRRDDALQLIPEYRTRRQPRTFPSVWLHGDEVYLSWPQTQVDGHAEALRRLCRRVTRIGHSSSLVQVWLAEAPGEGAAQWIPSERHAQRRMRVTTRGLTEELERLYKARIRPTIGTWHGYRRARVDGREIPSSVWQSELLVLRLSGVQTHHRWLALTSTLLVARRLREALIAQADKAGLTPLPEWISGHAADGSPSERPHLAVFPLAFVGHEHADGHLLGLGLAVPASVPASERRRLVRLVRLVRELKLGRLGRWGLAQLTWESPPWNLQSQAWTAADRGARVWGSVTPVVFDRHPKARRRAEAERQVAEQVADGCERIGLPRPARVQILSVSPHLGVPASHEFPRMQRKDGSERQHRHVRLWFEEPVRGPVAIGAGRYRGYGFCRPLPEKENA